MIYRSRNYVELEGLTKEQLEAVSCTTYLPLQKIKCGTTLLGDFIDRYLSDDKARAQLIADVDVFPETVIAHLNGIFDLLDDAMTMLSECQGIEETIEV